MFKKDQFKNIFKKASFYLCVSMNVWNVHIYTPMCIYRRQKRVSSILLFSLHFPLRNQRLMFSYLGRQPAWEILLSRSPSGLGSKHVWDAQLVTLDLTTV